jgi:hypothetical protein
MTGLKNPSLTEKFMLEAKVPMSVGNNMGIGYSAVKNDGNFFTERWHDNDLFFDRDAIRDEKIAKELLAYKKHLSKYTNIDQNYSLFGVDVPTFENVTTVTMHTRYATCGKEFANTHPFVDADHSLVHNGVISNSFTLGLNKISTCDSEAALQSYINHNVGKDISNAQAWLNTLSGYWAFGILTRDSDGTRILDVIRNDAGLYYSQIEGFGIVMATTTDIITSTATKLGLEFTKPSMIKENKLFRFNAVTGQLISQTQLNDSVLNSRGNYYGGFDWERMSGKASQPEKKSQAYLLPMNPSKPSKKESEREETQVLSQVSEREQFYNIADLFDFLYDVDEPLIDRLYEYDAEFGCNFSYMYECLPTHLRQDTWQFDDFQDVVDEIEFVFNSAYGEAKG